jgi:chaperone modulatory protein CbpM
MNQSNSAKLHPLSEAAESCGLRPEIVLRFVSYQWVIPADQEQQAFDEEDLARLRLIRQLTESFEVNEAAVPIILHLIDQLNRLHLEVKPNLKKPLVF